MRLYNAVCAWLEAHAAQMGRDEPTESREVQLDALVETAHTYSTEPELHAGYRAEPLYYEDRSRRRQPLGFQPR